MARGRKGRTGSIRSIRSSLPSTYSDALANERMMIKNQATLKYGGGAGRAFLYGFTKGLVGEGAASSIADRFRNKDKTERAFSQLTQSNSPKIPEQIISNEDQSNQLSSRDNAENKLLLERISAKLDEVALKVERIDGRLSPRNLTVGKGESQQTFRYDPLAPEGKKVTAVTLSGKSGRFASKKESASVLSKAAYLSNEMQEEQTVSKVSIDTAKKVIYELKKEVSSPKKSVTSSKPMTYTDVLDDEKRTLKAEKTLRYGGKGAGRSFLYGFTKGLIGESAADAIAQRFRNKKQTEEAYQQLAGPAIVDTVPSVSVPDMNPTPNAPTQTATQAGAADEKQQFIQAEKVEAEEEFRQEIMKKLDEILEKLNGIDSGGGGSGLLGKLVGGLGAAGLGGWLAKKYGDWKNKRKPGPPDVDPDKKPRPGSPDVDPDAKPKPGSPDADPDKKPKPETPDATKPKQPTTPDKPSGKGLGKVVGGAAKALRVAGPIGAAIGVGVTAYDAYQGFNADPNASIGDKFLNAGSSAINSATFGLLGSDADEIAAEAATRPQPQPDQGPKLPPGMDPESPEAEKIIEDYYNPTKGAPLDQLIQQQNEIDKNVEQLLKQQNEFDKTVEENLTQTQMPMAPTVINNTTQVPMPVPKSSGGSGLTAIQIRNTEPSVATYTASIFDHPVTHPGIYKM
jgi:hypothetical protein